MAPPIPPPQTAQPPYPHIAASLAAVHSGAWQTAPTCSLLRPARRPAPPQCRWTLLLSISPGLTGWLKQSTGTALVNQHLLAHRPAPPKSHWMLQLFMSPGLTGWLKYQFKHTYLFSQHLPVQKIEVAWRVCRSSADQTGRWTGPVEVT